jgi:hypothetical protein
MAPTEDSAVSSNPPFELFHAIADSSSAKVRKFIVDHELARFVTFRNVTYDEVKRDLEARGNLPTPALWDGVKLISGAESILARLVAYADVGRDG